MLRLRWATRDTVKKHSRSCSAHSWSMIKWKYYRGLVAWDPDSSLWHARFSALPYRVEIWCSWPNQQKNPPVFSLAPPCTARRINRYLLTSSTPSVSTSSLSTPVKFKGCRFTHNHASEDGGAICEEGGDIVSWKFVSSCCDVGLNQRLAKKDGRVTSICSRIHKSLSPNSRGYPCTSTLRANPICRRRNSPRYGCGPIFRLMDLSWIYH